ELELARLSRDLWDEVGEELGPETVEFETKGGLVVASTPDALGALHAFAERQAAAGVRTEAVERVGELEPH
ncbi:FAD-binding oxidoreductase, partial [Streptomyces sp. SID7499]|nr:FAD-binding oxidoreductase [Streptomyces sp. SID7499]